MRKLDESMPLIELHFKVLTWDDVPKSIRAVMRPPERHRKPPGQKLSERIECCSIRTLPRDLRMANYEMENAFFERRYPSARPDPRKMYYSVRFFFMRCDYVTPSNRFRKVRSIYYHDLLHMCVESFWSAQVHLNQHYCGEIHIPDMYTLNIHLKDKTPVSRLNGPFHPEHTLHVANECIQIKQGQGDNGLKGGLDV